MDKNKFRLIAGILLALNFTHPSIGQQNTIFNQSPFQRRQQNPQLRQQLQQQQQRQVFPNTLPVLSPPITPISPLSTPISPILQQQGIYRNYNQINPENYVPITAYQNELNYDGSFSYGYATADGTTAQAQGYVKNLGYGEAVEAQVVQGSYSYTSPEGTPITVNYIADENGFRAEGTHLPTQPFQNYLTPNVVNPYQPQLRQLPGAQPTLLPGQQLNPLQLQQQQRLLQQQQQQQQNNGQYQPGGGGVGGAGGGGGQLNRLQPQFSLGGFGGFNSPTLFPGGQQFGQFGAFGGIGGSSGFGFGSNLNPQQQQFNQQNFTQQQQQQNLQQQAAQQQQNLQQQQQQQQQQQNQQQQGLSTQELRGRPDQFVSPFGYNPYRRFKKAATKK